MSSIIDLKKLRLSFRKSTSTVGDISNNPDEQYSSLLLPHSLYHRVVNILSSNFAYDMKMAPKTSNQTVKNDPKGGQRTETTPERELRESRLEELMASTSADQSTGVKSSSRGRVAFAGLGSWTRDKKNGGRGT